MRNKNKSVHEGIIPRTGFSRKKSQKEFEEVLLRELLIDSENSDDENWDDAAWEELIRQGTATSDCTPTPEQRAAFEELLDLEVKQIQEQKRQIAQTRTIRQYKAAGVLRKAAAVAAICIIVIGVSLYCTVEAFAASVDRFIATVIPEQGAEELRIEEKNGGGIDRDPRDFAGMYLPSWIPKGYQVKKVNVEKNKRTLIYENESQEKICYEISSDTYSVVVDHEEITEEYVFLLGTTARVVTDHERAYVIWEADEHIYTVSGPVSIREDVVKMANQCVKIDTEE